VYKQRLARSGGCRAIVFFRSGERTFFVYGFAKSDRSNISGKELKWYGELVGRRFDQNETLCYTKRGGF
jgi:hypothetical protein